MSRSTDDYVHARLHQHQHAMQFVVVHSKTDENSLVHYQTHSLRRDQVGIDDAPRRQDRQEAPESDVPCPSPQVVVFELLVLAEALAA